MTMMPNMDPQMLRMIAASTSTGVDSGPTRMPTYRPAGPPMPSQIMSPEDYYAQGGEILDSEEWTRAEMPDFKKMGRIGQLGSKGPLSMSSTGQKILDQMLYMYHKYGQKPGRVGFDEAKGLTAFDRETLVNLVQSKFGVTGN